MAKLEPQSEFGYAQLAEPLQHLALTKACELFKDPPNATTAEIGEHGTQAWWTSRVDNINMAAQNFANTLQQTTLPLFLVDRHTSPSIGTRKPDDCIYSRPDTRDPFALVVVGDVKRRRSDDRFTDDECGCIADFLHVLIQAQPFRFSGGVARAYGYLHDCAHIKFFELSVENLQKFEKTRVRCSESFPLAGEGGALLLALLTCAPQKLHHIPPRLSSGNKPMELLSLLGSGASSVVYRARLDDGKEQKEFALKCLNSTVAADLERSHLTLLGSLPKLKAMRSTGVPTLGPPLDGPMDAVLMTPICRRVATDAEDIKEAMTRMNARDPKAHHPVLLSSSHFRQLIDTLRIVHSDGRIVHRDVRLSNIGIHEQVR